MGAQELRPQELGGRLLAGSLQGIDGSLEIPLQVGSDRRRAIREDPVVRCRDVELEYRALLRTGDPNRTLVDPVHHHPGVNRNVAESCGEV